MEADSSNKIDMLKTAKTFVTRYMPQSVKKGQFFFLIQKRE